MAEQTTHMAITKFCKTVDGSDIMTCIGQSFNKHFFDNKEGNSYYGKSPCRMRIEIKITAVNESEAV